MHRGCRLGCAPDLGPTGVRGPQAAVRTSYLRRTTTLGAVKRSLVLLLVLACTKMSNQLPAEVWDTNDYAAAGIGIDKPWGVAELGTAALRLEQVAKDHRERLPRFRGAKSGAVFAKLVADLADDSSRP